MSGKKKRISCSVWILLTGFCLVIILGLVTLSSSRYLIQTTAAEFGEPKPGISLCNNIQYAVLLNLSRNKLLLPAYQYTNNKKFEIESGENVDSILGRLEQEGIIPDASALRTYLQYSGLDTTIQAGEYEIPAGLSPIDIARVVQDSAFKTITFNVLAGWRIEEVAQALSLSGFSFSAEEFLTAASKPPSMVVERYPGTYASHEGFLFPGSYTFRREETVEAVIETMASRFLENLPPDFSAKCQQLGLTFYQCVTLSSIVEKESMLEAEQPLIASVFYNRLGIGMKLESDPTVQYAIGTANQGSVWWKNPLSLADLAINSAYNTYLYPGIPPTPIANPGRSALLAVSNPQVSEYYYFRAKCDESGAHNFAISFEEHLLNACP